MIIRLPQFIDDVIIIADLNRNDKSSNLSTINTLIKKNSPRNIQDGGVLII